MNKEDGLPDFKKVDPAKGWLYSSIHYPMFRICPVCGKSYKIIAEEGQYNYCPNCGEEFDRAQV